MPPPSDLRQPLPPILPLPVAEASTGRPRPGGPLPPLGSFTAMSLPRPLPHRRHHTCSQIDFRPPGPPFSILPPITASSYVDSPTARQAGSMMMGPGPSQPPSGMISSVSGSVDLSSGSHVDFATADDFRHSRDVGSDDGGSDGKSAGPGKKKKKNQRFFCTEFPPCELSFTRSEHLARHIRKHTGEKPFKCHCGRFFSRLDNLRQHAQTVHVNQAIPPDSLASFVSRSRVRPGVTAVGPGRSRTNTLSGSSAGHSRNVSASSIGSAASTVSSLFPPLESRMSALGIVERASGIGAIAGVRPNSDPHPRYGHGHGHDRALSVSDLPSFQFPPRPAGPSAPPPFQFPGPAQPDQGQNMGHGQQRSLVQQYAHHPQHPQHPQHLPQLHHQHHHHQSVGSIQAPPRSAGASIGLAPLSARPSGMYDRHHDRGVSTGHLPPFQFPDYHHHSIPQAGLPPMSMPSGTTTPSSLGPPGSIGSAPTVADINRMADPLPRDGGDPNPLPGIEALKRTAFERRMFASVVGGSDPLLRSMHGRPSSPRENGRLAVLME